MDKELTYGEELVGLTFNPSQNTQVDEVKRAFAKIIDLVHDNQTTPRHMLNAAEAALLVAQMWTVKVITWRTK